VEKRRESHKKRSAFLERKNTQYKCKGNHQQRKPPRQKRKLVIDSQMCGGGGGV